MRVIFIAPVVEVVNVDHEGEVGEGSQHEGGDEAGGDVVTGLPHKVHHHLGTITYLRHNNSKLQPFWCPYFLLHQQWCSC